MNLTPHNPTCMKKSFKVYMTPFSSMHTLLANWEDVWQPSDLASVRNLETETQRDTHPGKRGEGESILPSLAWLN